MIDIGLNLTSSQFAGEQADLVERARAAGVEALILTGTDLAGSRESAALAARWPGYCFSTAGVHPHDAKSVDEETLPALRELAALPQVVAIGECGLDYNRDFSPRPVQDAVFDAQLALAAELGMPVFLHCRDAHDKFVEILRPWLPRLPGAVLHCFTGSDTELDECLALGLHIGVTGWLCDERRGQLLREQVARIPAGRLMIETDAPYLVPRDLKPRPRRNEPAFLPHIAQVVAACRGEAPEALLAHTRATSAAFFQLPLLE
ncbi:TatD family hydrolase [Aeromonas caviae]|uniref:TatD family hydrolase n=1 Tax=Aeromonas caviae TaxID=648 RepID=UPI0026484548|nr:TatD family hydrolase [Aeromonas caviae]MDN6868935.1 TatD family hydrolase [Aeromonas caviae]